MPNEMQNFEHGLYLPIMRRTCRFMIVCYQKMLTDNRKINISEENQVENLLRTVFLEDYLKDRHLKIKYQMSPMRFEKEVEETGNNYKQTGRLDVKVINLTQENIDDEREYFVFECKRLKNKGKNQDYIDEGIARFVNNNYSKQMPLAGMIGFVEKSTVSLDKIVDDLNIRLQKDRTTHLQTLKNAVIESNFAYSYISNHQRIEGNEPIELYHLLFDYNTIIENQVS